MERMSNSRFERRIGESGWTQARLADLINDLVRISTGSSGTYTEESIRKLLRGNHTWPRKPYRDALCNLFDCTPSELGFYNSRARRCGGPSAADAEVGRQDFLRGVAALPVAAALPDIRQLIVEPASESPPPWVGMEHVEQVTGWAALFRQADDAGLGAIAGMAAQMQVATGYLDARMTPHVEIGMRVSVATFYRVAGWAYYDRGDHVRARSIFDRALSMVAVEGEWWVRAAILTCMARQSIYRGYLEDALDSLGMASIRADKLSMLRRADIAAVRARVFGRQGNRRECLRAVAEAEQYFAEARNEDHPDTYHEGFRDYYTENLLATDVAHGLFELALTRGVEVPATVTRLNRAQDLSSRHARSRLLSTAQLAALHLRRGDVDEGAALATEVVDCAGGTTSRRIVQGISRIHGLTDDPRIKKLSSVSELRQKSREFLRTV
ncbi:hypothetical protein [Nocardia flavorosea]|uniref:hypothetical protein n=1 Tax=Nocardia flavorosea TaxID=53429 RepID=UPI002456405F|nr:hypothetical protein [Nocardia flavorosea]